MTLYAAWLELRQYRKIAAAMRPPKRWSRGIPISK